MTFLSSFLPLFGFTNVATADDKEKEEEEDYEQGGNGDYEDDEDEDDDDNDNGDEDDDDNDNGDEDDEDEDEDDDEDDNGEKKEMELIPGAVVINVDGLLNKLESRDGNSGKQKSGGGDGGNEAVDKGQIEGLLCPICFEAWTNDGDHQICSLPCGHLYGFSCIKNWIQRSSSYPECPHCKCLCTLKEVRKLFSTQLSVADEELQKRVHSLEAECAYYKQKLRDLETKNEEESMQSGEIGAYCEARLQPHMREDREDSEGHLQEQVFQNLV